jgi:hypothetical protein
MKDDIREAIRGVFELTVQNIWGGFFWLALGSYFIWSLYKEGKEKPDPWKNPWYGFGWIGAVGAFLLGIVLIYWHLTGALPE